MYYSIFYTKKDVIEEAQATSENLTHVWRNVKETSKSALCFVWTPTGLARVGCFHGPFLDRDPE